VEHVANGMKSAERLSTSLWINTFHIRVLQVAACSLTFNGIVRAQIKG